MTIDREAMRRIWQHDPELVSEIWVREQQIRDVEKALFAACKYLADVTGSCPLDYFGDDVIDENIIKDDIVKDVCMKEKCGSIAAQCFFKYFMRKAEKGDTNG